MNYKKLYQAKGEYYFGGKRDDVFNLVPENIGNALDIGCSSGDFGILLKQKGMIVWGVEPNTEAADQARKKLDVVFNELFDENILSIIGTQKFDCIFFNDVLEHFADPDLAIDISKKLLNKGGYIISAIPNILQYGTIFKNLYNQDWEYTDSGIMDKTHLRFFTKKSIIRLFTQNGFFIEKIEGTKNKTGWLFKIFNFILFNRLESMKYNGFITVAKWNKNE